MENATFEVWLDVGRLADGFTFAEKLYHHGHAE